MGLVPVRVELAALLCPSNVEQQETLLQADHNETSREHTHQWSSHSLLVTAVAKERAGLMEAPSMGISTRWAVEGERASERAANRAIEAQARKVSSAQHANGRRVHSSGDEPLRQVHHTQVPRCIHEVSGVWGMEHTQVP